MHNGFVRVNEEKMSKSLGNFFTVREILARYRPETVRFFILNSHYRSPLNYCDENLDEAHAALTRLYTALRGITPPSPCEGELARGSAGGEGFISRFEDAMQDDFNTPLAISVLFDLAREINRQKTADAAAAQVLAGVLKRLASVLGLLAEDAEGFLRGGNDADGLSAESIEALIEKRLQARKSKNWAESDRIRDELKAQGVILEDSAQGTSWRRE
jgi:cysteinyl-tRNA synthetase